MLSLTYFRVPNLCKVQVNALKNSVIALRHCSNDESIVDRTPYEEKGKRNRLHLSNTELRLCFDAILTKDYLHRFSFKYVFAEEFRVLNLNPKKDADVVRRRRISDGYIVEHR